ncbi:branched-chain alpha-keto acid dehydrogenase subunit e2 : Catalytic domain of components of various dehydrogenase complexes OS=Sulfolobus islandicus (strain Y.N.15.51 / Yellowstone |uniref:Dihydrolipoamide acetyltransferase component of pyruvate dehydrogenase complex n=1 Tax=Gemmata massiliana TaxID=1210884 RepID=A0A6P2DH04_9BACT|nr:dihydrolipoamide acetyltransferase family protein [Gemmata massiliana]VTS01110.1 branched-chain alpha-keto acid dehydrogenase subunit e2 : Catalytic domain of components of various dehydrogenase complexes OS=Sulfolobus islandicus (strain Y.N.15.51 / Yellowstone \
MPIPVSIPRLGWNMEEGVFVEWLKADGDAVKSGDAVFRLEGEKATEDIESLDVGTLHIPATGPKMGDRLPVGAVIGYLLQAGEAPPTGAPPTNGESTHAPPTAEVVENPSTASENVQPLADRANHAEAAVALTAITPRARRLAARTGADVSHVRGTGRNGRVRERDIAALAPTVPSGDTIPLTATRRAIAAKMVESRQTTAPVTLTAQVDATNLVNLREQFKAAGSERVPSYTDFLLKFAAVALQKHSGLASQWTDAGIVPAKSLDIGIAVDTESGLLVPVVRNVPALGLRQLAEQTSQLIDRTRRGALSTRDMQGGCFTITNLGAFGIDAFTPIINAPECAILGVGRIERRPVMDGDRVVGRDLLVLSLTFDHRIVDGAPAARFLQALAQCVENPAPWVSS